MAARQRYFIRIMIFLFIAVSLLLTIFFRHLERHQQMIAQQFHGTLLEKPSVVKNFAFRGIDNKPFNPSNLNGHWTFVFFGFTNCGSICPTTMAELGKMYRLLEDQHVKILPNVVMITVDPKRDTLDKLSQYVKAFHPKFYGVRGEEQEIKEFAQGLGIAYAKLDSNDPKNYTIEHTGTVILFNPRGELKAFFTMPHQASLMAKDFSLLVS